MKAIRKPRRPAAPKTVSPTMIAERAYHISRSAEAGDDEENWLRAERELTAEVTKPRAKRVAKKTVVSEV